MCSLSCRPGSALRSSLASPALRISIGSRRRSRPLSSSRSNATRNTDHSFRLLGGLDPAPQRGSWAKRSRRDSSRDRGPHVPTDDASAQPGLDQTADIAPLSTLLLLLQSLHQGLKILLVAKAHEMGHGAGGYLLITTTTVPPAVALRAPRDSCF